MKKIGVLGWILIGFVVGIIVGAIVGKPITVIKPLGIVSDDLEFNAPLTGPRREES